MEDKDVSNIQKIRKFLNKCFFKIVCVVVVLLIIYGMTCTSISGLIQTWVARLGCVVMFVGGIMFGLGWKSGYSEQKARGISTMITGAIIVTMVVIITLAGTFFV